MNSIVNKFSLHSLGIKIILNIKIISIQKINLFNSLSTANC